MWERLPFGTFPGFSCLSPSFFSIHPMAHPYGLSIIPKGVMAFMWILRSISVRQGGLWLYQSIHRWSMGTDNGKMALILRVNVLNRPPNDDPAPGFWEGSYKEIAPR